MTHPRPLREYIGMIRAGRFRHRLLEDSFLQTHAKDIFFCLEGFFNQWRQGQIRDVEMAGIYILIFSFFRRPTDFLGGPHKEFIFQTSPGGIRGREVIETLTPRLPQSLRDKKILNRLKTDDNFLDLFCSVSWRSIPLSVPRSLLAWQAGIYPLNLMTGIPSPEQVLDLQCQGQRCVSMLIQESQIADFVEEGRDVLGFIVHDLIHADHFFADPLRAQAQVYFCQKLKKVYDLPQIQKIFHADAAFRNEFYYLMSDMNSVPLHLLKTLKAVLLGHFKRQGENNFTTALAPEKESEFLELFDLTLKPWDLDPPAWEAALRLNTPLAEGESDALLLNVALNKFS